MKLKTLLTDDDTLVIAIFDNGAMYFATEKSAATIEAGIVTGHWRKEEPTGSVYTAYVEQCGGGRPRTATKLPLDSNGKLAHLLENFLNTSWVGDNTCNDRLMSMLSEYSAE